VLREHIPSLLSFSIDSTAKADVNSPFPHVAKGQQRLYTLLTP
jgi:hypothetical protein